MPEDGPQIRPSRESDIDKRYESTELISLTSSTTSFHGNLMEGNNGKGLGLGIESPIALQTLC
jgi:hypothetical protein